ACPLPYAPRASAPIRPIEPPCLGRGVTEPGAGAGSPRPEPRHRRPLGEHYRRMVAEKTRVAQGVDAGCRAGPPDTLDLDLVRTLIPFPGEEVFGRRHSQHVDSIGGHGPFPPASGAPGTPRDRTADPSPR